MKTRTGTGAPRRGNRLAALLAAGLAISTAGYLTDARLVPEAMAADAFTFAIPAQPLAKALAAFAGVTGLDLVYGGDVGDAKSPGVDGTMSAEQALQALLAGTGFTYRFTDPSTVALSKLPAGAENGGMLAPLAVEGDRETAWSPVEGYIATRSSAGTKTDTPIIETPQSISVVTRDQMDTQGVETLGEALRYTAGVAAEPLGADNRSDYPYMRGFYQAEDGVLVDGLKQLGSSYSMWVADPYSLERLEVMRGPGSVLYGQVAPGGVINQVTKRPTKDWFGEVALGGGTYDSAQASFDFGGAIDPEKEVSIRLTGLGRINDTPVDFVEEKHFFIAPALTWEPSPDTSLTILAQLQQDRFGSLFQYLPAEGTVLDNPYGEISHHFFAGEPDFDHYDRDQYQIGYLFEHSFNDTVSVRQNLRYGHMDLDYETVYGAGFDTDERTLYRGALRTFQDVDSVVVDNQVQLDFDTGPVKHTFLLGADGQYSWFDAVSWYGEPPSIDLYDPHYGADVGPLTEYLNVNAESWQGGLYAQDQIKFGNLNLTLGLRQDWAETETQNDFAKDTLQQDDALTWRAGAAYVFDFGLAPYVSYAESFNPTAGTDFAGQPFKPEEGRQYEVGVKYQPEGIDAFVTVAAFDLARQNTLASDPDHEFEQIQRGEVRSRGIEVEGKASPVAGLNLIAAYSYTDVEITKGDNEGNSPSNVPEHMASLWADYTFQEGALEGFGFGAGVRYFGESFGTDDNTLSLPDYALVDATMFYTRGSMRFEVNASNVLDNEYVSCNEGADRCNYGEPLQVTGGIRYRW